MLSIVFVGSFEVPPKILHHGSSLRFFSWQIPTHLVAGLRILCLHKCLPDPQTQVVFLPVGAKGTGAVASQAAVAHRPELLSNLPVNVDPFGVAGKVAGAATECITARSNTALL